jgi:aerobic carbon-monoxide dehydrogenase medium subunit
VRKLVRVRDFQFLEPASPQEASRMLALHGEDSRLIAGGTALLLAMRQRMLTPRYLVYLGSVPGLDRIDYDERGGLRIGALARHADLAEHPAINARYPMLASMARQVANPQIRNMGTLGGNLCYGDPSTDPPGCLMALGARVLAVGTEGDRVIPVEDFFSDYYQTALGPDEVMTEIQVPPLPADICGAYTRFLRTPAEHRPLVGFAFVATRSGPMCGEARIAIGASTPIPSRARRAEQFLAGKRVTREVLEEAAGIAAADITPVSDFRGSADYRRDMVRVVARRTLLRVFGVEEA